MCVHLLRRQWRSGDRADRMPAVAMPGCASERGAGMPANPDPRVRLLRREGFAADIGVAVEAAIEAGWRLGPELLENRDPLIGHCTASIESGAVQRLKFFLQPAGADTQG